MVWGLGFIAPLQSVFTSHLSLLTIHFTLFYPLHILYGKERFVNRFIKQQVLVNHNCLLPGFILRYHFQLCGKCSASESLNICRIHDIHEVTILVKKFKSQFQKIFFTDKANYFPPNDTGMRLGQ